MVKLALVPAYIFSLLLSPQRMAELRREMVSAISSSKTTDSLYSSLNTQLNKTPIITCYIAALQALKAKHSWNPYFKFKYLNDSEKTFDNAVTADPQNMEIRFMRFSVEHYVPVFLGDDKDLYADREEIIDDIKKKRYTTADKDLVTAIVKFLLASKRCTPAENTYLTKQLNSLK